MPILAIDTATLVSSVAIATQDTLVAELTIQTRKTHSERLMPHIASLLSMAEMTQNSIKAVAVSIGPGSFTGLRIGLATAKAMAYALHIPLIGVPTLAALAFSCPVPGVVLAPMLDAQKENVYLGLYEWQNDSVCELQPPQVVPFTAAKAELDKMERPALMLGEAAVMHKEDIAHPVPPHVIMPRAGSVAAMAQAMYARGIRHDIATLEPLYIRRSEAEVLWERRHSGACQ
ncbi:tRNA (adenosine(37)-N6)-threonylcarbamoyltransferase complex dimerization subunit type 1 TsaB [Sporomusa acidovorans]|uniref:tRNA threonylcarbamoyladenosine biosynthesis protein TsaB n=1 Tax=Sporomusa acidovorans (strain ATCC 49682 / DSM 3132 / Mol) TaxID=1123286 RepID=A0ABZ3IZB0_SPOA4|nr:tRNA (adenosine(37)-N6)-threonylcarbamoyltransferase complex dimerization subunit type 1 TsaB [Sporomusa acidovorans]OZC19171.1 tRNA threonylcarbamoyladenosine biosynthesis protein TsaB [Sporomusa acidovorans DSM 3132]SDF11737.1 tRNA threonylcarbamoyladenosine biosynthesis protein TsaB [Sporomusa acidovorans]